MRSAIERQLVGGAFGAFLLASCTLFVDTEGLSGDASATNDAGSEGAARDGDGGDAGAGACPGTEGPKPVAVGSYCIDSTEVTNRQYARFLTAKESDTTGQTPECAWNTSFTPLGWPVAGGDDLPVTQLDWCDAYAFCRWAGKRLCGAIGGGPTPSTDADYNDAKVDQWFRVCTSGGARRRPYGNIPNPGTCNVTGRGGLVAVGSLAQCTGGEGAFDMVGNATEWVDSCKGRIGPGDDCLIRESWYGGSIGDECSSVGNRARGETHPARGFRCCSD